jgi:hypothetical protein
MEETEAGLGSLMAVEVAIGGEINGEERRIGRETCREIN